ncbi:MAG TPA: transporter substrate-binding domain-containing protein [Pararhizobium sp.]|nr:transporter substrate-binding domain-containing protein [Pararhizobium sp.]
MKFSWLTMGFAALAMVSGVMLGTAASAAAADKPLTVLTDPSFVPFEMKDNESGKMVGFDMDMLREIAKRAGFDYNLKTMNFEGIIPALQARQADMAIAGITITDARSKVVDFSDPYYDSGLQLLVPVDNGSITKISDLKGKAVGTKIGSTSSIFLKKNAPESTKITPYPSGSNMFMALLSGSVDAVLYDQPNVAYFAQTKGKGKVKTVGKLYEGQSYGIALKKGSEWLPKVNKALADIKADGTYDKIYEKWFGKAPEKNGKS